MKKILIGALVLQLLAAAHAQSVNQAAERDPVRLLERARDVLGFARVQNRVLHYKAATSRIQPEQSDRTYPPFFSTISQQEIWLDPASGVMRLQSQSIFPGASAPPSVQVDDGSNVAVIQGQQQVPVSRGQVTARDLSAWAVIADWSKAADVQWDGAELYRDYSRVVLKRHTSEGEQKLFLDPKSGFPVKLDLVEPHYLWGQRHIEYVWSTWLEQGGIMLPGSSARLTDGETEISLTLGEAELIATGAAPSLTAPPAPPKPPAELPMFLRPLTPEVTRIAPDLLLLSNPGYNEAAALANGEIYVLDATQGEERARLDAAAIAQAFPGRHHINVVVTDTAWPHISGLRYWVAQGASVISQAANREFLQRVIDRKWTLKPDLLEQRRSANPKNVHLDFVAVDRMKPLAAGAVRLIPIDGIGSELALMAYLPKQKFLWASDYVQTVTEPSLYASEVLRAAERAGISPERVAAEHLPPTDWKEVQEAQRPKAGPSATVGDVLAQR